MNKESIKSGIKLGASILTKLTGQDYEDPLKKSGKDLPNYSLPGPSSDPYRLTSRRDRKKSNPPIAFNSVYRSKAMSVTSHNDQRNIDATPLVYTAFRTTAIHQEIVPVGSRAAGAASIRAYTFSMADVINAGASMQRQRAFYLMNLFQEYRLRTIGYEFKSMQVDITQEATNGVIFNNTTFTDVRDVANLPWDMVYLHDRNDAVFRGTGNTTANDETTIMEIWNMEEMTGARRELSHNYHKGSFDLTTYASTSLAAQPDVAPDIAMIRPIEAPWLPTKVSTAGSVVLNLGPIMSCIKLGIYNLPLHVYDDNYMRFPANSTGIRLPIGIITWSYVLEFRMREFRAITGTLPAALMLTETEEDIETAQKPSVATQEQILFPTDNTTTSMAFEQVEEKEDNGSLNKKPRLSNHLIKMNRI